MNPVLSRRVAPILLGVVGLLSTALAGDWAGWRGTNRDGKSTDTGLLKQWTAGGPQPLWKVSDIGKGYSSVAVVKDTVYTSGDVDGQLMLYAFDLKGQPKWKVAQGPAFSAQYPGSRATPVVDGDRLYILGGGGTVSCHATADGTVIWKRELKEFGGGHGHWGYSESPLVVDDKVIVTPGGATAIVALDKATGKDVWKSAVEAKAHYASAIAIREKGATLIVQGTGSGLFAVDARDGRKVWSSDFCAGNTANCPDPAYADGYLFWANGYGKGGICFKVDYKDGAWSFTEAWQTKDMICHHGGYVIDQGHVYGNHNNGWSCLDLKTGKPKWTESKAIGKGSLCFADGMLVLFSEKDGQAVLAAASPDGFAKRGGLKVGGSGPSWAHPAVANGRLFLRYDTNLYCFDVRAK